jgi:hypothetical protein
LRDAKYSADLARLRSIEKKLQTCAGTEFLDPMRMRSEAGRSGLIGEAVVAPITIGGSLLELRLPKSRRRLAEF